MAFDGKQDPYTTIDPDATDRRIAEAKILEDSKAHLIGNRLRQEKVRLDICYKNGMTVHPRARKMFMQAAMADVMRRSTSGHSDVLKKNMADAGYTRPSTTSGQIDAHHIVSSTHPRADSSRKLLFGWKIAINDADNGVYLPHDKSAKMPGTPDAVMHEGLHTKIYHAQVYLHLREASAIDSRKTSVGRSSLKEIKNMLIQGIFPYRQEHLA